MGDGVAECHEKADAALLARVELILVGGAGATDRLAAGETLDDLTRIEVLGRHALWDIWSTATGRTASPRAPSIRCDNATTALSLAAAGAGVTVVYAIYAAPFIRSGRLQPLAGPAIDTEHRLIVMRNPARKSGSAVRDFMSWMTARFVSSP